MSKAFPEHIDLMRLANLDGHFQGAYNIARMQRLSELLANKECQIDIDVQFGINEQNRPYFKGTAHGQLSLPCQRCMEPVPKDIDVSFELLLAGSDHKFKQLAEDNDVLLVDTVPASFIEIVEDELLLGFPAVYMHDESECSATEFMQDKREVQINEKGQGKVNPFDVLKDLKIDS